MLANSLSEAGQIIQGTGRYMEAMDPLTRETWMCISPVTQNEFDTWTPEAPKQKTFTGIAAMDVAGFRHDPAGPEHSAQLKPIGGRICLKVAVPNSVNAPEARSHAIQISVTKAHTIGFRSGRNVKIMTLNNQHFVEVVGNTEVDEQICFPTDAVCHEIELRQPWLVELPNPTQAYFWFHKNGPRSFQGPISLPI